MNDLFLDFSGVIEFTLSDSMPNDHATTDVEEGRKSKVDDIFFLDSQMLNLLGVIPRAILLSPSPAFF